MNPFFPFHVMVKPRGAICNLDCSYCYFLKKEYLYPDGTFRMSDETLELYTRQYIESQQTQEVSFAWQGGEPSLMGLDFFQKAVDLQEKYKRPGMRILNTFQTNATLLDDAWAEFFHKHNFLLGVSLDGPPHLHNPYRKDKGGKPSFERVNEGLKVLNKYKVDFNILTTVHSANAPYPLEVYRFLRDETKTRFIQFIPIVERVSKSGNQEGTQVTRRSVTAGQYGQFLIKIFDEWVRHDVGEVFIQIFDIALAVWMGYPAGLCIFDKTCGRAAALEHTGDLFSCDHFVEPDFLLGNIHQTTLHELMALPSQSAFGLQKQSSLPRYCQECKVRFICNGECPKNRIRKTPDGESGLNYLCAGYKAFFNHIDRPMRMMAGLLQSGRPAKDIMQKFSR